MAGDADRASGNGSARTLVLVAATGAILGALNELISILTTPGPVLKLLMEAVNLSVILTLIAGVAGLFMITRSKWWLAAGILLGLRFLSAAMTFVGALSADSVPQALSALGVGLTWGALGLALLMRRRDGRSTLGLGAGILFLLGTGLWLLLLVLFQGGTFLGPSAQAFSGMARAAFLLAYTILAAYLLAVYRPGPRPGGSPLKVRLTLFAGGAGACLLIMVLMAGLRSSPADILITGVAILAFAGLAFLLLGVGYLGFTLAGIGAHGAVAAGLNWLMALVVFGLLIEISKTLIWVAAAALLLASVAGGFSFLRSYALQGPGLARVGGGLLVAFATLALIVGVFLIGELPVSPVVSRIVALAAFLVLVAAHGVAALRFLLAVGDPPGAHEEILR